MPKRELTSFNVWLCETLKTKTKQSIPLTLFNLCLSKNGSEFIKKYSSYITFEKVKHPLQRTISWQVQDPIISVIYFKKVAYLGAFTLDDFKQNKSKGVYREFYRDFYNSMCQHYFVHTTKQVNDFRLFYGNKIASVFNNKKFPSTMNIYDNICDYQEFKFIIIEKSLNVDKLLDNFNKSNSLFHAEYNTSWRNEKC